MCLKIFYIYPPFRGRAFKAKLINTVRGRKSYFNQEGFFVESLKTISEFKAYDLYKFKKVNPVWDLVVIDSKSTPDGKGTDLELNLEFLSVSGKRKKILFVSNDRVEFMPSDEVLDSFDLVFKREPWKNIHRYKLSEKNKKKIFPTMLPCPLVLPNELVDLRFKPMETQIFDIFFNGQATNVTRVDTWSRIKKECDLRIIGGLQPTWIDVPTEYRFEKLSRARYKKTIHQSKINLAIEGIGTFTYRHLELLSQGAFMMSHSNIKQQNLPVEIIDGEHYVAYNDVEDLILKIRYYLDRPDERRKIARSGFDRFKRDYSFERHGRFIKKQISNV